MAEIDAKLAEQLKQAEPTAEEAFEKIAAGGKKKKKADIQWGDEFIEELNLSLQAKDTDSLKESGLFYATACNHVCRRINAGKVCHKSS